MSHRVKRTISIPREMLHDAESLAASQGTTLSKIVEDALRKARIEWRARQLGGLQGYWSRVALGRGIVNEQDLERYLRKEGRSRNPG